MLKAYGDESYDDKNNRVFAVASLFGNERQWGKLEEKWSALTNGIVFHASDCESDQRDFAESKGRTHEQNQTLYRRLTTLLCESGVLGYGVALDRISQRKYMPDLLPESAYYKCFGENIMFFARQAYMAVEQTPVQFIFEQRPEIEHSAKMMNEYMADLPEWQYSQFLNRTLLFKCRQKDVGLQAADLWAREVMKFMDNDIGPKNTRFLTTPDS